MASLKKTINFNEYWPWIKSEAARRGWNDSEFMRRCNIPRQRYYEFIERRNLTGTYMHRIMEGMGLSRKAIEEGAKTKMSDDQRKELRKESWVAAHTDIVEALMENTALVNLVQQQITLLRKK
jgi:hypothetical protein